MPPPDDSAGGPPRTAFLVLWVCLVGGIFFSFIDHSFIETRGYVGCDFEIFLHAAERIHDGKSPYPTDVIEPPLGVDKSPAWGGYIYPAFIARLLSPFAGLEAETVKKVYLLLCFLLYVGLLFPWRRIRDRHWAEAGIATALVFGWGPVIENFRFGQSNFIPLLCFALAWRLAIRKEEKTANPGWKLWASGCLMGIGSSVKLVPLIGWPFFVIQKRWKIVFGMAGGVVLSLLVSGPLWTYQYFFKVVPSLSTLPELSQSMSLPTMIDHALKNLFDLKSRGTGWSVSGMSLGAISTLFGYLLLLLFISVKKRDILPERLILLVSFLPPLFLGVWFHHYILAVLPLSVLVPEALTQAWREWNNPARLFRGIFLLGALLPGFTYWGPVKFILDLLSRTTFLTAPGLFLTGFVLTFLLLFPDLVLPQHPSSGGEAQKPALHR